MYQPKGFRDSENIIIIDNVPHFSYNGVTYKDKLKNGLSLEYVFQQEDMILPIMEQPISIETEPDEFKENYLEFIDYEEKHDFYEKKEIKMIPLTRKGKYITFKKRQNINFKKNLIKLKGYECKLFDIEQNLPELIYESEIKYIYRYDCDRLCRMAYYNDQYDNDNDNDNDEATLLSNRSS
jgi:hypothetical protein